MKTSGAIIKLLWKPFKKTWLQVEDMQNINLNAVDSDNEKLLQKFKECCSAFP